MNEQLLNLLFLISRYTHVLAASLLVGGTLFYELIMPVAIDDLKDEQKLSVFARARWAFRWIVWCSAVALLLSGTVSSYRNWYAYNGVESAMTRGSAQGAQVSPAARDGLQLVGPGRWWLAHVIGAIVALGVAASLVIGGTPPRYPLVWMRVNLLLLLLAIFMASAARHFRLRDVESHLSVHRATPVE